MTTITTVAVNPLVLPIMPRKPQTVDTRSPFGAWLIAERNRRGFTQTDLAAAAQLSASMISKLEAGKAEPSRESVSMIAAALAPDGLLPSQRLAAEQRLNREGRRAAFLPDEEDAPATELTRTIEGEELMRRIEQYATADSGELDRERIARLKRIIEFQLTEEERYRKPVEPEPEEGQD